MTDSEPNYFLGCWSYSSSSVILRTPALDSLTLGVYFCVVMATESSLHPRNGLFARLCDMISLLKCQIHIFTKHPDTSLRKWRLYQAFPCVTTAGWRSRNKLDQCMHACTLCLHEHDTTVFLVWCVLYREGEFLGWTSRLLELSERRSWRHENIGRYHQAGAGTSTGEVNCRNDWPWFLKLNGMTVSCFLDSFLKGDIHKQFSLLPAHAIDY